jgi:hypothetical protein
MNIEIPDNSLVQAPFVSEAGSAVRYLCDGTNFYPAEPRPLYRVKKDKLSEIAEARWKNETGGLTVQGMTIDTSRESQALITGAALQATLDPTYTCHWKTAGGFVNLTAANVLAVAVAARQHVQGYFDREAELSARVEEATTVGEVQAIVWDEEPEDSEEAVEV